MLGQEGQEEHKGWLGSVSTATCLLLHRSGLRPTGFAFCFPSKGKPTETLGKKQEGKRSKAPWATCLVRDTAQDDPLSAMGTLELQIPQRETQGPQLHAVARMPAAGREQKSSSSKRLSPRAGATCCDAIVYGTFSASSNLRLRCPAGPCPLGSAGPSPSAGIQEG